MRAKTIDPKLCRPMNKEDNPIVVLSMNKRSNARSIIDHEDGQNNIRLLLVVGVDASLVFAFEPFFDAGLVEITEPFLA